MDQFYNLGFTSDDLIEMSEIFDDNFQDQMQLSFSLLSRNILFLKEYGCSNYTEVFMQSSLFFLLDTDIFKRKILSYKKEELLPYLLQNPAFLNII